jgi:rare lipoprotein A (peptidoglycan hydrolase)
MMLRRGLFATRISWLMWAALGLGGCSAYNAPNVPLRPAPAPAVQPLPTSSAGGRVTVASWYGPGFVGQRTASGEVYHRDGLTAASRSLPIGTRVQVTNLKTGRAVVVRINDRGPYVRGRGIDLSQRAAERIGLNHSGVARVSVTRLDATASASSMPVAPEEWRGKARVSPYTPRQYRRTSHYPHHYTHHYQYASASTYHSSHRMVANPVGEWLLQMVR